MLSAPTPFPEVGSYGLYHDPAQAPGERRTELVRILERGSTVALVAFPLRDGAGGNRRVALADIIDGTPLDDDERRELADLQRHLHGRRLRSPKALADKARMDTLASRAIWSGPLQRLSERAAAAQRRKAA